MDENASEIAPIVTMNAAKMACFVGFVFVKMRSEDDWPIIAETLVPGFGMSDNPGSSSSDVSAVCCSDISLAKSF